MVSDNESDSAGSAPPPPEPPRPPESEKKTPEPHVPIRTRRIYGGFISAIGFAIEVVVMALLVKDQGSHLTFFSFAGLSLVVLAIAVVLMFRAMNMPNTRRFSALLGLELYRPVRRRTVYGLVGVALLIIPALGFGIAASPKHKARIYDLYAVVLPAAAPAAATPPGDRCPAPKTSDTAAKACVADAGATLTWWAERKEPDLPDGLMAMFLGGLLTIAVGLWYPRVDGRNASGGLASVEKLVAPLLSLGLVALGAGQHDEASKVKAGMEYARQGLPPAVMVNVANQGVTLRILPPEKTSPETATDLGGKLDDLRDELKRESDAAAKSSDANTEAQAEAAANLQAKLTQVAGAISKIAAGDKPPTVTVDTSAIARQLSDLAAKDQAFQRELRQKADDNRRQEREKACERYKGAIASLPDPELLRRKAKMLDDQMNRGFVARSWTSFTRWLKSGVQEPTSADLRAEADRQEAQRNTLKAQYSLLCDPNRS